MPAKRWFTSLACFALLALSNTVLAEQAKELQWDDLIGAIAAYDDPFLALTSEQLSKLSIVARIRGRIAADKATSAEVEEEKRAVEWLAGQDVDADALIARRVEITAKRQAAAAATDPTLHGERIRMPGFMLPLEFEDTRVTEFLLVPFVGACIHVPPPPPNQIVHVSVESGFEFSRMYEPVWIEGRMTVGGSDHDLFLKDGSAQVPAGYSLLAERVERY